MSYGIEISNANGALITDGKSIYEFHSRIVVNPEAWYQDPFEGTTDPGFDTGIPITEPPPLVFIEVKADGEACAISYIGVTGGNNHSIHIHSFSDLDKTSLPRYAYIFRRITPTNPYVRLSDWGLEVYNSNGDLTVGTGSPLMVRGKMDLPQVTINFVPNVYGTSTNTGGSTSTIPTSITAGNGRLAVNIQHGEIWEYPKESEQYIAGYEFPSLTTIKPIVYNLSINASGGFSSTLPAMSPLFIDGSKYD